MIHLVICCYCTWKLKKTRHVGLMGGGIVTRGLVFNLSGIDDAVSISLEGNSILLLYALAKFMDVAEILAIRRKSSCTSSLFLLGDRICGFGIGLPVIIIGLTCRANLETSISNKQTNKQTNTQENTRKQENKE